MCSFIIEVSSREGVLVPAAVSTNIARQGTHLLQKCEVGTSWDYLGLLGMNENCFPDILDSF